MCEQTQGITNKILTNRKPIFINGFMVGFTVAFVVCASMGVYVANREFYNSGKLIEGIFRINNEEVTLLQDMTTLKTACGTKCASLALKSDHLLKPSK